MVENKLLSEKRVWSFFISPPEDYEVHCKHLLCQKDYYMGSRKFIAGEEYDIWVSYAPKRIPMEYVVHGISTRDEDMAFSTNKVFGSLIDVISAPETQNIFYGRWMYHLVSLPDVGKVLVPDWAFISSKVRSVLDAETRQKLNCLVPGILNALGHNRLVWLIKNNFAKSAMFIDFESPLEVSLLLVEKIGFFAPLSQKNTIIGNNSFSFDGARVLFS